MKIGGKEREVGWGEVFDGGTGGLIKSTRVSVSLVAEGLCDDTRRSAALHSSLPQSSVYVPRMHLFIPLFQTPSLFSSFHRCNNKANSLAVFLALSCANTIITARRNLL